MSVAAGFDQDNRVCCPVQRRLNTFVDRRCRVAAQGHVRSEGAWWAGVDAALPAQGLSPVGEGEEGRRWFAGSDPGDARPREVAEVVQGQVQRGARQCLDAIGQAIGLAGGNRTGEGQCQMQVLARDRPTGAVQPASQSVQHLACLLVGPQGQEDTPDSGLLPHGEVFSYAAAAGSRAAGVPTGSCG